MTISSSGLLLYGFAVTQHEGQVIIWREPDANSPLRGGRVFRPLRGGRGVILIPDPTEWDFRKKEADHCWFAEFRGGDPTDLYFQFILEVRLCKHTGKVSWRTRDLMSRCEDWDVLCRDYVPESLVTV